jgi:beta-galactosidase
MKYLGCAYYPEYWGVERVATDARLMRAAGINIARIGEFAWSRMEPREGHFTLRWLHRTLEILGRHGIKVMMCTPTAAPPAWLTAAYPEVLLVRADGTRAAHGGRRHYCSVSGVYRRHSGRITEVLSREMARHRNVVAWQLDNEFGPEVGWCHCDICQERFRAWLKDRYGTVEKLNRRWKTGFWSVDFSDWSQVRLGEGRPDLYPALKLDSRRFWSDMMVDLARSQTAVIRRNHPSALVTTNGMGPVYQPIDYYELFKGLDVACDDLYFDIATMDASVAAMNVFRCVKPGRPFWVTETGSGALDHCKPPHPDQFRAWAWSSFAHGAEAHFVFRWRTCLSGQEQELQGILEHSGKPRHRYRAVRDCFREFASLRRRFKDLPLPRADVAIVQDYQVLWGYESSRIGSEINYLGLIFGVHRSLYRRNIPCDIVPPGAGLGRYKVVILPSLVMLGGKFAAALRAFVRKGGQVLALGQLGIRDHNDNYLSVPGPEHVADLVGARIEGGMYLRSHVGPDEALFVPAPAESNAGVAVRGTLGGRAVEGQARGWIGDIALDGGEALMSVADGQYGGQPAVVAKRTGKGRMVYVAAARLDDGLAEAVLSHVLTAGGVRNGPQAPVHVEVVKRGRVTFAINHTGVPTNVKLGVGGKVVVGRYRNGEAALDAYGVCVVEGVTPG